MELPSPPEVGGAGPVGATSLLLSMLLLLVRSTRIARCASRVPISRFQLSRQTDRTRLEHKTEGETAPNQLSNVALLPLTAMELSGVRCASPWPGISRVFEPNTYWTEGKLISSSNIMFACFYSAAFRRAKPTEGVIFYPERGTFPSPFSCDRGATFGHLPASTARCTAHTARC